MWKFQQIQISVLIIDYWNRAMLTHLSIVYGHLLATSESDVAQSIWLFVTPWTVAHQAPPSTGLSRQEYWNGLPFPSPGQSWIACQMPQGL